jgi:3D (Asp-Asp-Asp) domain-containing protein
MLWRVVWLAAAVLFPIYGAAAPAPAADAEEPPERPGLVVTATITAYTSSPDETDADPFIAASGKRVHNRMAACPARYPFGTIVVINGREYRCEDRMNSRYRNQQRFDIWMETKDEARQWGIRTLEVKVIIDENYKEADRGNALRDRKR